MYEHREALLQRKIDRGDCSEETSRKLQDAVKDTAEFKQNMQATREWDRRLGKILVSSGYRCRETAIGESTVDWALIRLSETRVGSNVVCEDIGASCVKKC